MKNETMRAVPIQSIEGLIEVFNRFPPKIERVSKRQLEEEYAEMVGYPSSENYGFKNSQQSTDDDMVAIIRRYHTEQNPQAWMLFFKSPCDKKVSYNLWIECLYGKMAEIYPELFEAISRRIDREKH